MQTDTHCVVDGVCRLYNVVHYVLIDVGAARLLQSATLALASRCSLRRSYTCRRLWFCLYAEF